MLDLAPPNTRSAEPAPVRADQRPDHQIVAVESTDVGYGVRLAAAGITALTVLLVAFGAVVGADGVQAFAASAFFLAAVGSAGASLVRRISLASYLFFSVAGSLTVTLLGGFALAETHLWYPAAAFVVLAAVSLAMHAWALYTRGAPARLPRLDVRAAALPVLTCALGFVLLVAACVTHAGDPASYFGQFGHLGVAWFAGLALIVLAVPLGVRAGATWVIGVAVMALATALALTPALVYEYPTVTSAARHVGVAQVIRHLGGVVPNGGIYHAWPGLFAGSGMIWDVGHVTDPLAWARWFPVLINPVAALGVYVLGRRLTDVTDVRLWLAAAVFAVTNILGNAYFSPQSTCFVLAMAVLALAVPTARSVDGRGKLLRLTGLTVVAFAITITHQLTPYLVALALFVLVVAKLVRPWYVLALVAVPAVAWALLHYKVLEQFINLGALGNATANAAPPNHGGHLGYRELTKVAIYAPLALFLLVGLAALVTALRTRTRFTWALLACAVSPALLFFGNAYGNEAIFRVSLFSLPWLCLLLAVRPARRPVRATTVAAGLLVGAAVFAVGTYGMDWYRDIRPGTVSAVRRFEQTAPAGSVAFIPGSGNALPGRLTDNSGQVQYVDRSLLHIPPPDRGYRPARDVAQMTDVLIRASQKLGGPPAVYVIVNTATGAYDDLYGIQRYADFERMSAAFAHSGYWRRVYEAPSATVYRLDARAFRRSR